MKKLSFTLYKLNALGFLKAFEESACHVPLSQHCDDSDVHIFTFQESIITKVM